MQCARGALLRMLQRPNFRFAGSRMCTENPRKESVKDHICAIVEVYFGDQAACLDGDMSKPIYNILDVEGHRVVKLSFTVVKQLLAKLVFRLQGA